MDESLKIGTEEVGHVLHDLEQARDTAEHEQLVLLEDLNSATSVESAAFSRLPSLARTMSIMASANVITLLR